MGNHVSNKEDQPTPYLQPGVLYRLRGLKKNKEYTHMQAYKWGSSTPRLLTANPNHHHIRLGGQRLYTDGDLFLCLKITSHSAYNSKGIKLAYLLLAPDGKQVLISHYQNKGKFARAK